MGVAESLIIGMLHISSTRLCQCPGCVYKLNFQPGQSVLQSVYEKMASLQLISSSSSVFNHEGKGAKNMNCNLV